MAELSECGEKMIEAQLSLSERIDSLVSLGKCIIEESDALSFAVEKSFYENGWFIAENILLALRGIKEDFLQRDKLEKWIEPYNIVTQQKQRIALILAGNIPLVGFHDVLSCYIMGHQSVIKLSHQDAQLIPYVINKLIEINPKAKAYFEFVERVSDYDAVIATGSNTTADLFERYFKDSPHIIRRNRNGLGVLTGNESVEDLRALAKDIFTYFGLGCRNVSKIYIPIGYDLEGLLEVLHENKRIVLHHKYKNNYDYNYAIFMLNKDPFLACGAILIRENEEYTSRIACLHYEYYDEMTSLQVKLQNENDKIQCIVSENPIDGLSTFRLGEAQSPALWDYADGIDTLAFLQNLGG